MAPECEARAYRPGARSQGTAFRAEPHVATVVRVQCRADRKPLGHVSASVERRQERIRRPAHVADDVREMRECVHCVTPLQSVGEVGAP